MAQERLRILLVEAAPSSSTSLCEMACTLGPDSFLIQSVDRLPAALERLKQGDIDVVLVDIASPDIDMVDALISAQNAGDRSPIVVVGGVEDEQEAVRLVQNGVEDYLIRQETDARSLERSIRYAIERRHRRRAEASLLQAQAEIAVARDVQQALFPQEPLSTAGFDLAGGTSSASPTGGDYFDFVFLPDGSVAALIADARGHGLPAALVMAETRSYFRAFALNCSNIGEIATLVNRCLHRDAMASFFVTMLIARLDSESRSLLYVNAGHPSGYIVDRSGRVRAELRSLGMPLGIGPTTTYEAAGPFELEDGARVVLVTDGVLEARAADGSDFGLERLLDTIRRGTGRTAAELVADVQTVVQSFSTGRPQRDDITLLLAQCTRRKASEGDL